MSKIYTKTGDKGETSVLGKRVKKSCIEIKALGDIDELNASIGILASYFLYSSDKITYKKIINVQKKLFVVGSNIASIYFEVGSVPKLSQADIDDLEQWIDYMDHDMKPLQNFVLPGGCQEAAQSFFARAICRRAERSVFKLKEQHNELDSLLGQYLNRLSDVLFVLARWLNFENKTKEIIWEN
jgi:cob(I)alamin adenosyltransferase